MYKIRPFYFPTTKSPHLLLVLWIGSPTQESLPSCFALLIVFQVSDYARDWFGCEIRIPCLVRVCRRYVHVCETSGGNFIITLDLVR